MRGLVASGEKGLIELVAVTHTGMTTEEFNQIVAEWLKTAKHPKYDRPYDQLVYQPMLELLGYLQGQRL